VTLTLLDLIGHSSFLLTAISFGVRDMMFLRILAIISGLVGIYYNYSILVGPLWIPIFWLSIFVFINVVRIFGIILDKRSIAFNPEEAELHETLFRKFSPVEFMKLMRIGEWGQTETGQLFSTQGEAIGGLYLLFNGEVLIERDGTEVGRARDGAMIGEMSFVQGGQANATVAALKPCRYVYWPGEELHKLLLRNPGMDVAMKHVFSTDLMRKLSA